MQTIRAIIIMLLSSHLFQGNIQRTCVVVIFAMSLCRSFVYVRLCACWCVSSRSVHCWSRSKHHRGLLKTEAGSADTHDTDGSDVN